ncbi:MAG TPA: hypothetical protein VL286_07600 [Rhizomicrobium sp.]|jgi:hypothetical protein|nr:hypothetical protein [Rhizomicrobium sp.]
MTLGLTFLQTITLGLSIGGLGALMFAQLRSAGGRLSSAAATGFAVAQPAFLEPTIGLKAALLAIMTYAISVNAIGLLGNRDPRRIIQLGGSLAGAQLLNPVAGTLVSAFLPLTFRGIRWRRDFAHAAGLYLLLLFIPALTALGLFCLWKAHPDLELFAASSLLKPPQSIHLVLFPLLAAIPVTPALFCAAILGHRIRSCEICAAFAATAIASATVASSLGVRQHPAELIAALSPLSIVAFRHVAATRANWSAVQFSAASTCMLSWGVSSALAAVT